MRVVSLFAMTGAAIVAAGATALSSYDNINKNRVNKTLLQEIERLCGSGGGVIKEHFSSDEVIDELSCDYGGSMYENSIETYNDTIRTASEKHPDYNITYTIVCDKYDTGDRIFDHWTASNTNKYNGNTMCGLFEEMACETTFVITKRKT